MRTQVIIPARLGATRLPGKPLALLGGVPVVVWAARQAIAAVGHAAVVVATDADAVATAVRAYGVQVAMTGPHACGTDRVAEVAARDDAAAVINVQGDEPFVDPADISALAAALAEAGEDGPDIATLATPLASAAAWRSPDVVKVVCDDAGRALYFSRAPIPYARAGGDAVPSGARRHLGLYAFRRGALLALAGAPPHALERHEGLEQLRALALGMSVAVLPAQTHGRSIDTPDDLAWARAEVARRGLAAFPALADVIPEVPHEIA